MNDKPLNELETFRKEFWAATERMIKLEGALKQISQLPGHHCKATDIARAALKEDDQK